MAKKIEQPIPSVNLHTNPGVPIAFGVIPKKIERLIPLFLGVFVFIAYLFTLAPSVIQIDSGELAAVQILPGVAHPTGYPLFTILGYLWSLLPLPFTSIYQQNLLAALCTAGAVVLFYLSGRIFLRTVRTAPQQAAGRKQNRKTERNAAAVTEQKPPVSYNEKTDLIAAIFSSLLLAFGKTFWFQSTSVEVYSLHLLLLNGVIYSILRAVQSVEEKSPRTEYYWYGFALLLALAFSNHLTTMLFLPGAAFLYFNTFSFKKQTFIRIGKMLIIFIPVLVLFYGFLSWLAGQEPLLNWGKVSITENLLRHVSAKQYQVWLFSSVQSAVKQMGLFFSSLPPEYYAGLLFSIIGSILLFIKDKRYFWFLFILFFFTAFYSSNYDIKDIDSYFLLAYIAAAFFALFGYREAAFYLEQKKLPASSIAGLFIILGGFQFFMNYPLVTQHNNYTFEDYTRSALSSCEPGSVVLVYQWDYFISPSIYFQLVEGFRNDVIVIDKELLRRSWYYDQLKTMYPDFIKLSIQETERFQKEVKPFEADEPYNAQKIEAAYRAVIKSIMANAIKSGRALFIGPELAENEIRNREVELPEGVLLIPDRYFYRVGNGQNYYPMAEIPGEIRWFEYENEYTRMIKDLVGGMKKARANYEDKFGKSETAKRLREEVELLGTR